MQSHIIAALDHAASALDLLRKDQETIAAIAAASTLMTEALKDKKRIFSCGNGGSFCDAMHFAEELSGRFRDNRPGLAAMAISDAAHITCTGNDYGFDHIYARYLEAHAQPGDVLLAISTSGKSANVIRAAEYCRGQQVKVVALTGHKQCQLAEYADIHIATPAQTKYADRVQELHIKVIHSLIELIERQMFPQMFTK